MYSWITGWFIVRAYSFCILFLLYLLAAWLLQRKQKPHFILRKWNMRIWGPLACEIRFNLSLNKADSLFFSPLTTSSTVSTHPFLHSNVSSSNSAVHLFFLAAPVHHALLQEVLPGWPLTPGSWAAYKQLILSASCLAWTGAAPILVCLQMGLLQEAVRVFVCLCVRLCNVCV